MKRSNNGDGIFTLKHTNVSQPQISHASSKQSITASEEYQSARERSSSESNDGLLRNTNQYSTPPSTPDSAAAHTHTESEESTATYVPSRPSIVERGESSTPKAAESQIRRKPVASAEGTSSLVAQRGSMGSEISPPTPGVDDTPYIRFAIDQLTRDEEVRRGSRRYPVEGGRPSSTATTHPHKRQVEGLRYSDAPPPVGESFPESRQALRIQTPEPAATPRPRKGSPPTATRPSFVPDTPAQPEIFVPFDNDVPSMRFLPRILRPLMIAMYAFLLLLILIALLFSGIWSSSHNGLYGYTGFGDARYFVFEYLPTLCGIFLLLWLFQIQVAVQRISPFIAMASMSSKARSQGPLMDCQPTGFLLPKLFYFRAGLSLVGICMFTFWLQIITVPLLTCLYNVYYYGPPNAGSWRWTTVQGVVWTLFALYLLQILAIVILGIWINRQRTGLRWDARSMADLAVLVDRSNIVSGYANSEVLTSSAAFQRRLAGRSDRLGFWHTSNSPMDAFYALGEEGAETRRYSLENGRIREKESLEQSSFPDTPTTPGQDGDDDDVDLESADDYERIRHRYIPWLLRPSMILTWSILAILLFLAFLIASFVNRAVIHGFAPLTKVAPSAAGFSATNFTYSFIPALIGHFLFLAWLSIDHTYRRLQPYAAMSSHDEIGATATNSLLLDYPARMPFTITLAALVAKDFRISWYSLLTLISSTLPLLAGGCFWAQYYSEERQVRVAVDPPAYYALCVFLALYAVTLPTMFVGLRKRRLPHAVTTVAEQISFLYSSKLLGDSRWRGQVGSKAETVSRLVAAPSERERSKFGESCYVFGRFVGRDGRTHLGIERLGIGRNKSLTQKTARSSSGYTSREIPPAVPRQRRNNGHSPGISQSPPEPSLSAQSPTRSKQDMLERPYEGSPAFGAVLPAKVERMFSTTTHEGDEQRDAASRGVGVDPRVSRPHS